MLNYSRRIRAHAIRRCGELPREIEPSKGGRHPETRGGAVPSLGRTSAAEKAGLSERRRQTALCVANVPVEEFERAVESDQPPLITDLARRGKVQSTVHLRGRSPEDFQAATSFLGMLRHFTRAIPDIDVNAAIRGLSRETRP
jgi:hypothetical protein